MKDLRIIFVDQLSVNNSVLEGINPNDTLLFYEPIDTFYEIKHHKQKIALLVSALRHFINKINHKNLLQFTPDYNTLRQSTSTSSYAMTDNMEKSLNMYV